MRTIQKVTGYRGINQEDNRVLNNFIAKVLREYQKLPGKMMEEFGVIQQMAEHRVENIRIIQGWKEFPEDKVLKLSRSAWREGFLAGVERVRLVRADDLKELREKVDSHTNKNPESNNIQSVSKGLDGPVKTG